MKLPIAFITNDDPKNVESGTFKITILDTKKVLKEIEEAGPDDTVNITGFIIAPEVFLECFQDIIAATLRPVVREAEIDANIREATRGAKNSDTARILEDGVQKAQFDLAKLPPAFQVEIIENPESGTEFSLWYHDRVGEKIEVFEIEGQDETYTVAVDLRSGKTMCRAILRKDCRKVVFDDA